MTLTTISLSNYAADEFAYLTTVGRKTGKLHRIEIWFAAEGGVIYLMAGGRERSDWVKNLQGNPQVSVELAGNIASGVARIIDPSSPEDERCRLLLVAKYQKNQELRDWGRNSLAIAIELNS